MKNSHYLTQPISWPLSSLGIANRRIGNGNEDGEFCFGQCNLGYMVERNIMSMLQYYNTQRAVSRRLVDECKMGEISIWTATL